MVQVVIPVVVVILLIAVVIMAVVVMTHHRLHSKLYVKKSPALVVNNSIFISTCH